MMELAVAATSYDRALAAALSLGDMARRISHRQRPESVMALIATIYTHTLYNNAPRETTGRYLSISDSGHKSTLTHAICLTRLCDSV